MSEYADRDIIKQGNYYTRHVSAMTSERLHDKSDIAAELAHRDIQIDELATQVERLRKGLEDALCLEAESAGPSSDWHPELHHAVDALNETPAQSLAAVRAEAVESVGSEILEFGHLAKNQNEIVGIKMAAQICEINAQRIRSGEV